MGPPASLSAVAQRPLMNFDRIAPFYRGLERLTMGPLLKRARSHFLPELRGVRRALLVGEGDGRFLVAALAALPDAEFTVVDASGAMLRLARDRTPPARLPRVTFVQARLPDWEPPAGAFDLLVTHFFLDCCTAAELPPVLRALANGAASRCTWLVAEFQLPPRGLARLRARALVGAAYAFFRVAAGLRVRRVPDFAPGLTGLGFRRESAQSFSGGLLSSARWVR